MSLDQHFREAFEEAEIQAPQDAWESIEGKLQQKRKRRIIPLWFKRAAVAAAVLLLGVFIGRNYWPQPSSSPTFNPSGNSITTMDNHRDAPKNNSGIDTQTNESNNPKEQSKNPQNINQPIPLNTLNINDLNQQRVVQNVRGGINSNHNYQPKPLLNNRSESNEISNNPSINPKEALVLRDAVKGWKIHQREVNVAQNELKSVFAPEINDEQNPPKFDELSLALAKAENKEDPKTKLKNRKNKKFGVGTYFSPIIGNAFSEESLLSNDLDNFEKSNPVTTAYGVNASYALNDRLKVRTGVGVMNLTQNSNGIPLTVTGANDFSAVNTVSTVDYQSQLQIAGNIREENIIDLEPHLARAPSDVAPSNGQVVQTVQYLEVPLEMEYAFFQTKKFTINAVAGGSAFFLTDNAITAQSEQIGEQALGEANNLNSTSFSTNAAIKLDYQLKDNLQINLQPQLRYLLNPTSSGADTNPIILGVGAGLSIKF